MDYGRRKEYGHIMCWQITENKDCDQGKQENTIFVWQRCHKILKKKKTWNS